jgi:hypothetical protein
MQLVDHVRKLTRTSRTGLREKSWSVCLELGTYAL